jgi:hypothetical protein
VRDKSIRAELCRRQSAAIDIVDILNKMTLHATSPTSITLTEFRACWEQDERFVEIAKISVNNL